VIEAVDNAMLELQHALSVRMMYPPGKHVQTCQERVCEMVQQILQHQRKLDVFVLDDRVIFDDRTLPSSVNLVNGLFGLLYRSGVDRITFHQGLEIEEIRLLLDELADCKIEGSKRLQATPHVIFSFIRQIDAADSTPPQSPHQVLDGREMTVDVNSLWRDIEVGEGLNVEMLTDIVTNIIRAVSDHSDIMLPLVTLKRHDEYSFVHVINVAILSTTLSESLGFDDTGVHEMCIAALLHDIGKQHIPRELLNKKGRLTNEELQQIQMHPVEGARMLLSTPGMPELAPIVAFEHHVCANGGGYPKVPQDWQLNLASRMVQIVDVFDALRTHRPYRQGLSLPQIIEIFQSDMNACFDADLLDVFFQHIIPRYHPEMVDVIEAQP